MLTLATSVDTHSISSNLKALNYPFQTFYDMAWMYIPFFIHVGIWIVGPEIEARHRTAFQFSLKMSNTVNIGVTLCYYLLNSARGVCPDKVWWRFSLIVFGLLAHTIALKKDYFEVIWSVYTIHHSPTILWDSVSYFPLKDFIRTNSLPFGNFPNCWSWPFVAREEVPCGHFKKLLFTFPNSHNLGPFPTT